MEASKVRACVEYEGKSLLVKFKLNLNEEELLQKVLKKFDLNIEEWENYELLLKGQNCKLIRAKDLIQDDRLLLKSLASRNLLAENNENEEFAEEESIGEDYSWISENNESQQFEEASLEISNSGEDDEEHLEEQVITDISVLKNKKWKDRDELKTCLKKFSSDNHIKLSLDSQERIKKDGTKISVFFCSKMKNNQCGFSLEFRTKSGYYRLETYSDEHNHEINEYDDLNAITPQILARIKALKRVTLNSVALTKAINDEFEKNFQRKTIYYQMKKLEEEELGVPNEDAHNLNKLLETEAKKGKGFYKVLNQNGRLKNCCYMSNRMIEMSNYFSDVLIIDTSHKTNRFNLPLIDIVCINNLGKTTTCFLGLMTDQTFPTFVWILEAFRSQLKKTPSIIFTDEEEALTKGNRFFNYP